MDLALAVFNIGAGLGVLAAGGALAYLAWQATPLIRESRALAVDLRRLARATDAELRPILTSTQELTSNVEVLSEDVAVKLDRLTDLMNSSSRASSTGGITVAVGTPARARPVESWETREDSIEHMKDSGFGSFLAGVVIGGLIGAALGLHPRATDRRGASRARRRLRRQQARRVGRGGERGTRRRRAGARRDGHRVRRRRGPGRS